MNYDRKETQKICEIELGDIYAQRKNLNKLILTDDFYAKIKKASKNDLKDLYYKGLVSLFGAIKDITEGRYSWATIKLYYSVYYFLRAEMIARGTILVRAGGIHRLTMKKGEHFYTNKERRYNSDHSGTILHYISLYKNSDILLSNSINGKSTYEWLLEIREIVNYRQSNFLEPSQYDFWSGPIGFGLEIKNIEKTLSKYLDENPLIFVFQDDHAILGVPLVRLKETVKIFNFYGFVNLLSSDQKLFLKNIIDIDELNKFLL